MSAITEEQDMSESKNPEIATTLNIRVDHKESGCNIFVSDSFLPLSPTDEVVARVVKRELPIPGVFVLENFLTPEECTAMVECTEAMGFEAAKLSTHRGMVMNKGVRNNARVIWHTQQEMIAPLFDRLQPFMPNDDSAPPGYEPYALNQRLRIFKYSPGQRFLPHFDGGYAKSGTDRSWATFIVYLQAPVGGGQTNFFDRREAVLASVEPVPGTALVFYHDHHPWSPCHEGAEVTGGLKYALRSDVMYRAPADAMDKLAGWGLPRHF